MDIDTFILDIIDRKQLPGLTEEARSGLLEEMRENLLSAINRSLIDALPDEKVAEFSKLLDDESITEEQVQAFIVEQGVDVEKVTAKTLLAFRSLYLQPSSETRQE